MYKGPHYKSEFVTAHEKEPKVQSGRVDNSLENKGNLDPSGQKAEDSIHKPLGEVRQEARCRKMEALAERIERMYRMEKTEEHMQSREFVSLGMEFLRAAERGVVDKVQKFIDMGFPVNFQAPDTLETALHRAASTGARRTFDVLVNSGKCDYLLKDKKGRLASEKAYLFNGTKEMEDILTDKEIRQAKKQGVGLDFFRPQY